MRFVRDLAFALAKCQVVKASPNLSIIELKKFKKLIFATFKFKIGFNNLIGILNV